MLFAIESLSITYSTAGVAAVELILIVLVFLGVCFVFVFNDHSLDAACRDIEGLNPGVADIDGVDEPYISVLPGFWENLVIKLSDCGGVAYSVPFHNPNLRTIFFI